MDEILIAAKQLSAKADDIRTVIAHVDSDLAPLRSIPASAVEKDTEQWDASKIPLIKLIDEAERASKIIRRIADELTFPL